MEYRDDTHHRLRGARPSGAEAVVHDRAWAHDVRTSVCCAGALLGLLLLIDGAAGSLSPERGALWLLLAALLFVVLFPVRVSAGTGWPATRRLWATRRVRTDLLVAVGPPAGVAQRLVLRDALGDRVEIDPAVLTRNPGLWYRLAEGARAAETAGTLRCGTTALHDLSARLGRETALGVFRASGLD
ncbi:hypothetical protein ACIHEJ_07425 [Streptomyces sp. NPDC052301]|uniref:hypothetical protein n=1 Tax=Streptomyces sp. NPDC052301 TaxID=3365687 RepID=UPI0037D817E8